MRVILFGATGMVGQGVLRECLLDPGVAEVLTVGRNITGQSHPKLREIEHRDLLDLSPIAPALSGSDACFFCLGVSSFGMPEADYRRITYDITLAVAVTLIRLNPQVTFLYVSGAGTDSSEQRRGWARIKGQTENALLRLPFHAAYMFRPALIVPEHGIVSRTWVYRILYRVLGPVLPLLHRVAPRYVTTTSQMGRAMILAARRGAPKQVLENDDINRMR
jgi:uncharacterized protein YbjT (DUF2867 family)